MRLPVPSIGGAAAGIRELTDALAGLVGMTSRASALLPRVEALVVRIDQIADDAEKSLARANDAIDAIDLAAARATKSIDRIDAAAGRTDAALLRAETIVAGAQDMMDRSTALLASYAGPLGDLAPAAASMVPALRRIADTVSDTEVDAVVGLIDELPGILDQLRTDIIPLLHRIGPDVHATMEIVDDVRQIINGLPGAKLFRRRGEEEDAEAGR